MDDDESLLVTTAAMLLREGYDVRTARDGFEALAVLRGSVPEPVSLRPEIAEVINRHARATLKVAIAGDLHHYRRHESVDGSSVQLITSGGGGAFLLGTAGPKVNKLEFGTPPKQFALQSEFPDRKTSLRLLLRNFAFPFINPKFGLVTGIIYLLIACERWHAVRNASNTAATQLWCERVVCQRTLACHRERDSNAPCFGRVGSVKQLGP